MVRYAFENMDLASFEQKLYYDENRRDEEFEIGDIVTSKVYVTSSKVKGVSKKLSPKREGPFVILFIQKKLEHLPILLN